MLPDSTGYWEDVAGSIHVLVRRYAEVHGTVHVFAGNSDLILRLHSVQATYPKPGGGTYDPMETILSDAGIHFEDV